MGAGARKSRRNDRPRCYHGCTLEPPPRSPALRWGSLARAVDFLARRRRRPLARAGHAQLPTLAVHGLALGGAGKTPLCAWLARRLAQRLGGTIGIGTRSPAVVADEIAMLRRRLPDSPVFAADDSRAAVAQAGRAGCRALVLDDPSLTRAAPAHYRAVCLGPGDDWTLPTFPAGERRPGCIGPAEVDHLVLFDGAPSPATAAGRPATRARTVPRGLLPLACYLEDAAAEPGRSVVEPGTPVFLLCAIARPERLARTAEALGLRVVGSSWRRDHAALPPALRREIEHRARTCGARLVVVTEKDAARIGAGRGAGARADREPGPAVPWVVATTDLELDGEGLLDAFLASAVRE